MTLTVAPAAAAAPQGFFARAVGVLTSPRATYAGVAAQPRWIGALLFVVAVSGAAATLFVATEVGQRAVLDQQLARAEASGRHLSDAQMATLEGFVPYYKYFAFPIQLVTLGIGGLVLAGILFAVFTALLGADGSFTQVFAVVSHSGIVLTVAGLFALPIEYAQQSLTNPTSLAVFLPFLDDDTFMTNLLGAFDLVRLWWTVNLAIGLAVLYRRRTAPVATALIAVYAVIALVYAAATTAF